MGIMVNGINNPGYFTTIALIGGIQLISIGVVGEYIGRIYYEVKQRPKYIVKFKRTNARSQSSRARERKSTLIKSK